MHTFALHFLDYGEERQPRTSYSRVHRTQNVGQTGHVALRDDEKSQKHSGPD